MKRREWIQACAVLGLLPHAGWSQAASLDIADAINIAGRQRMLTQRIVKAYCLQGLGARNVAALEQRHSAIERFETHLSELAVFVDTHPEFAPALEALQAQWRLAVRGFGATPSRGDAVSLLVSAEAVLSASERLTATLAHSTVRNGARILNMAGRQRMLSQRLVMAYAFLAWGLENSTIHRQFIAAWNAFEDGMRELRDYDGNTPVMRAEIAQAEVQWLWMQGALSLHGDSRFYPDIVEDAGEKLLQILEKVTAAYVRHLQSSSDGRS